MRWAGSFVAQYVILHRFKTNTVISSKLYWNCFTIAWSELKAKTECKKVRWKTKWLTTQASTLQQQAQIQIPNLNGRMSLLRIYSKRSVILRQWWSSRIYVSTQKNHANTRKYVRNCEWALCGIFWTSFLRKTFDLTALFKRRLHDFKSSQSSFGLFLSPHHLLFLH